MDTIKYKSGYKHQLTDCYSCETGIHGVEAKVPGYLKLWKDGVLWINRGYAWDGASGFPDVKGIMRGSLVHDSIYQLIRMGQLSSIHRRRADALLREMYLVDSRSPFKHLLAPAIYGAVRTLGKHAAGDPKPTKIAP